MKRLTDTDIWDEDWFIDLPNDYKLFFLYIKDKCDHSGMWRPNRRKLSMVLHGKTIMYDDFLLAVNKDENTGVPKKRVVVLENGKWFITKFITFQCGNVFNIKIGAHRGALKLLIFNNIHPSEVPGMDWRGIDKYDLERLKEIGHGNGLYALSQEYASTKQAVIEKEPELEKEKEPEKRGKEGPEGKPIFKLQHLYDRDWNQVDTREPQFRGTTPESFAKWKAFVDWIVANGFQEIFRAIFVTPADFAALYGKGFTESVWEKVVSKLLSTGIKPENNLYFRIPDFMKYAGIGQKNAQSVASVGQVDYKNQEKW